MSMDAAPTITEFLLARIAEDEAMAEAASPYGFGERWEWASYVLASDRESTPKQDEFIEEWWPARVLRECAGKRAIVDAHPIVDDVVEVSTRIKWGFACATCFSYGDIVEDHGYCDTLRALAAVYADHPDYQQEWALDGTR
mgnify:CR=1 FL=1